MKMTELKKKAEEIGVDTRGKKKRELVLSIQAAEGNAACYSRNDGSCPFTDCCFYKDCFKENEKGRK